MAIMGAPGFDDAPFWTNRIGAMHKDITLVYPYYDNPKFLVRQLQMWEKLPAAVKERVRVIVVDDGSPIPAYSVIGQHMWMLHLRLFRIEVDIRWNWLAARNIGMQHAKDGWCVLTDMDHVIPVETFNSLIFGIHSEKSIYRFSRKESTGEVIHPHPNSMLMTRAMFWKVGGYDEKLSGFYGSDGDWRRRCAATAPVYTLNDYLVRHEYQEDSSTTHYLRKQAQDAGKKAIIRARPKIWKPRTLSFPYHEVAL